MSARLILFTHFPRPGEAKSRLIPVLGAEGAANLYREMAEHCLQVVDRSHCVMPFSMEIRYAGCSRDEMINWLGAQRPYRPQTNGDLGSRLSHAFEAAFREGYQRVVVIVIDCPDLSSQILNRAFDLLIRTDLVLGPALDGGYYLVGLRHSAWERARHTLFSDIPWGTDSVLSESTRRAYAAGIELTRLDCLADVDRPKDLIVWERHKSRQP